MANPRADHPIPAEATEALKALARALARAAARADYRRSQGIESHDGTDQGGDLRPLLLR